MTMIRILLVDDNPEYRCFATLFLEEQPGLRIVGTTGSGAEALALLPDLQPDLVLLDLAMPGMNGLETARAIKDRPNAPRVIILTGHDDELYRQAAEACGVDVFLNKTALLQDLVPWIDLLFDRASTTLAELNP